MLASTYPNGAPNAGSLELGISKLQGILRQQTRRYPAGENIAIIGCGYVGTALAAQWQLQGHFVTGTTTRPERATALQTTVGRVAVIKGEDIEAVRTVVRDQDTIVVSVAPTSSYAVGADVYETVYLETARNLAKAISQSSEAQQIVYLSSGSVYGDRSGGWVDESTPVAPTTSRSQVLYEAEQTLLAAASDRHKVCILRLGGIYGPGRELVGMFGGLAGTTLPGTGDRVINWIHRDDILSAIEFARARQLQGIYNLVDDAELTVRGLIELMCRQYDLPNVSWDSSQPTTPRSSLRVSNRKLKAAGYKLRYPQPVL